jgi:acetoin utilization protein AcuB
MLVKNWMNKEVMTVDVNALIQDAAVTMKEHGAKILPVLKQGKLVGILTEGDLKRGMGLATASLEIHELLFVIARQRIKDIMTPNPITIPFDSTVEEAAELLIDKGIPGAPVVDDTGRFMGLITQNHILRVLLFLTGAHKQGIQIGFQLENRPGSIKEVTDIMRRYGCRLISILSTYDDKYGHRHVYIRALNCDSEQMEKMKEELRSASNMLYFVDYREKRKEHYTEYARPASEWFVG